MAKIPAEHIQRFVANVSRAPSGHLPNLRKGYPTLNVKQSFARKNMICANLKEWH